MLTLAIVIGYYVIGKVHHALHTPLMSITNAISRGHRRRRVLVTGRTLNEHAVILVLAGIAIVLASINIFGGFAVTRPHARDVHPQSERSPAERPSANIRSRSGRCRTERPRGKAGECATWPQAGLPGRRAAVHPEPWPGCPKHETAARAWVYGVAGMRSRWPRPSAWPPRPRTWLGPGHHLSADPDRHRGRRRRLDRPVAGPGRADDRVCPS